MPLLVRAFCGVGNEPAPSPPDAELPEWMHRLVDRLRGTVFKAALAPMPEPGVVNWRCVGRMAGILVRGQSWWTRDAELVLKKEGLGDLTEEEGDKIWTGAGMEDLRPFLLQVLKRGAEDKSTTEELVTAAFEKWMTGLELQKDAVVRLANNETAANQDEFWKGFSEGFTLLFDAHGGLAGDKGRTQILLILLTYWVEIEEMRRAGKSRRHLHDCVDAELGQQLTGDLPRFRAICDDIGLVMKSPGRPRKPETTKSDPQ